MNEQPIGPAPDTIEIIVPARVELASTLRVLVSSLGAEADFSIDEIDDLRLAVSEVFTSLAENAPHERCATTFTMSDRSIAVTMSLVDYPAQRLDLDPLAIRILSAVLDEHAIAPGMITMLKRGAESTRETA